MLIEVLTIAAGKVNAMPGEVIDLPTKEAKEWIANGFARANEPEPKAKATAKKEEATEK